MFKETYPRDELIQSKGDLLKVGKGILTMQDRDVCRLFVRRDVYGRFFSCMVYVTNERFNTALRIKSQKILKDYFNGIGELGYIAFLNPHLLGSIILSVLTIIILMLI